MSDDQIPEHRPQPRARVRDRLWTLADRYGEDYVREGVRLLKRLQVAAVLVGVAALGAVVVLAVWLLR